MKKSYLLNGILLLAWWVSVVVILLLDYSSLSLFLPVIPAFCSQLLLCRVIKKRWVQLLPAVFVLLLLGISVYFYATSGAVSDLRLALTAIAPTAGIIAGWLVWWLTERKNSTGEC